MDNVHMSQGPPTPQQGDPFASSYLHPSGQSGDPHAQASFGQPSAPIHHQQAPSQSHAASHNPFAADGGFAPQGKKSFIRPDLAHSELVAMFFAQCAWPGLKRYEQRWCLSCVRACVHECDTSPMSLRMAVLLPRKGTRSLSPTCSNNADGLFSCDSALSTSGADLL